MQNHFWLTSKLSEGDKCGLEHILVHLGSEVADEEVGAHIQRLHQGHHGHGGLHPQLEGQRPGGALWIYFFHVVLHSVCEVRFGWPW